MNKVKQNVNLNIISNRSSIVSEVSVELLFDNAIVNNFFEGGIPIPPNAIIDSFAIYYNNAIVNEIELCEDFSDNLNSERDFHPAVVFQDNVFIKFALWNVKNGDSVKISFNFIRKQIFSDRQQNIVAFSEIGVVLTKNSQRYSLAENLDYIPGTCFISYKYNGLFEVTCYNYKKIFDELFFYKNSKRILRLAGTESVPPTFVFKSLVRKSYEHFAYYNKGTSLLNLSFSSKINFGNYYFTTPKTLTIVIECSSLVMGIKFEQIKKAAITALTYLNSDDKFAISGVGKSIKKFAASFCEASEKNIEKAILFIKNLEAFDDPLEFSYVNKKYSLDEYLRGGCFVNFEGDILVFRNSCPSFYESKLSSIVMKNFSSLRYYGFVEINKVNCSSKELSAFCSGGYCEYIYSNCDIIELTRKQMLRISQSSLMIDAISINGVYLSDYSWISINSNSWRKRSILIDICHLKELIGEFDFKSDKPLTLGVIYSAGTCKKVRESYKVVPVIDNNTNLNDLNGESKFFKHLNLLFTLQKCNINFCGNVLSDIMKFVNEKNLSRSIVACNTTILNNKDYFLFVQDNIESFYNDETELNYVEDVSYEYDDDYNEEGYFRLFEEPEVYEVDA